jgi:hypothetical protein
MLLRLVLSKQLAQRRCGAADSTRGVVYIRSRPLGMVAHVQRMVGRFVQLSVGVQVQCAPSQKRCDHAAGHRVVHNLLARHLFI